ncbi:MAG TPA: flagellar basal body-associated FliL family protein [Chloroflexota bacterium]|nr:flagellar basal body-associated FliL family protein [Chloroflexota bacterium]
MGRLIPLLGAAIVALLLGGGGGWFVGQMMAPKTIVVAEEKPHITEYTIKDRVVNLADQGARKYLKVSMVLQVAEKAGAAGGHAAGDSTLEFTVFESQSGSYEATASGGAAKAPEIPNAPAVHDAITTVLSSKRSDELVGNDGKERLKDELKAKINTVLPTGMTVQKILFTDFIIQ